MVFSGKAKKTGHNDREYKGMADGGRFL